MFGELGRFSQLAEFLCFCKWASRPSPCPFLLSSSFFNRYWSVLPLPPKIICMTWQNFLRCCNRMSPVNLLKFERCAHLRGVFTFLFHFHFIAYLVYRWKHWFSCMSSYGDLSSSVWPEQVGFTFSSSFTVLTWAGCLPDPISKKEQMKKDEPSWVLFCVGCFLCRKRWKWYFSRLGFLFW